jgi:hypothetical protein
LVSGSIYGIAPNLLVFHQNEYRYTHKTLGLSCALHNAQKPHAARAAFAQTPYSQLMDWYDVPERSEGKSCSTQRYFCPPASIKEEAPID